MRNNIVHIGAGELTYEIRAIVEIADKLQILGIKTNMENIGDPVAKGEKIPSWMKKIVADLAMQDCSYGYCPTRGVLETRQFLAEMTNRRGKTQITADDIIFFNGLGDAIQKVYGMLRREARVIGPSPTYSTHSSGEAAHAGQKPISYRLDPDNNWYPDLDDLRLSIKYNPAISGILIINPDNPTGAVYPERILREMVAIAREFDLFVICDEIYHNIVYNGQSTKPISDLIGDVPAHRHEGDQQGGALARRPLRLDRDLQCRQGPDVQALCPEHPGFENGRGLLHHPAAEGHPADPQPPAIPGLPGGAQEPLREVLQYRLRSAAEGCGDQGEPHQRRLLYVRGFRSGAS